MKRSLLAAATCAAIAAWTPSIAVAMNQSVESQLGAMGAGQDRVLEALTQADRARLSRMEASRKKGVATARNGDPGVFALAMSILDAPAKAVDLRKLKGNWKCRTFSLGGTLGSKFWASKTGFFRCRIVAGRKGFSLRKLSGSMAWSGTLRSLDDKRVLYYGTAIARGDKIPVYPASSRFSAHQVGILQQITGRRLRIEMPEPRHKAQSFHDLIELVR